jgi:hypothetical protein
LSAHCQSNSIKQPYKDCGALGKSVEQDWSNDRSKVQASDKLPIGANRHNEDQPEHTELSLDCYLQYPKLHTIVVDRLLLAQHTQKFEKTLTKIFGYSCLEKPVAVPQIEGL